MDYAIKNRGSTLGRYRTVQLCPSPGYTAELQFIPYPESTDIGVVGRLYALLPWPKAYQEQALLTLRMLAYKSGYTVLLAITTNPQVGEMLSTHKWNLVYPEVPQIFLAKSRRA